MKTALTNHPAGNYSFVPGIAPYSCGIISNPGFEVVHVTMKCMLAWEKGFQRIEQFLAAAGRPKAALCAMSLRCPQPFTFAGFTEFNAAYAAVLQDWDVFVDGINPVARTHIAPELVRPNEPSLFAFAYTRPCEPSMPPTFVVAGAGELPEGVLNREGIIRLGEFSSEAIAEKTEFVMDLMESRLNQLGTGWDSVTRVNVYTNHPADDAIARIVNPRIGPAGIHGVTWHFSRPPIEEIEYEMDIRGVRTELMVAGD